ncbi:hypothetical protein BKA67DRAFT_273432 [Truncatella angustata]|uniref:Uncharacterized protein n=1 Tax=Truncatella angustata TaxID=152316 RepID=A0A9P8ZWZ0_9PEZI|nr:uncharacterized protein BKA67DRAFT_273432 [Truncatella angustata]KAH6654257.1 hypothetical protein BKA67DRAFT_273432 [Truncatella angustata]
MADDDRSASPATAHATGRSPSANNGHLGYGMRRARTMDETAQFRRRSSFNPAGSARSSFTDVQRRGSTFSDLSHNADSPEDGLWNLGKMRSDPPEQTMAATLPLVLALLPALGGLFFEGGNAFATDIILLGLAAVFLRWSVTQPWNWYHAAQEVRVAKDMAMSTPVFETDSDLDLSTTASATTAPEHMLEGEEKGAAHNFTSREAPKSGCYKKWQTERDAAAKGLRRHEKYALAWCFLFPLLGALLLHTIRGQLSQRSEGLVSDYNLHIFVIAAEIRPISHLIGLLHNSTLRKQRIMANNPYEQQDNRDQQFQDLYARIEELETRLSAGEATVEATTVASAEHEQFAVRTIESSVTRNFLEKVQPEVDSVTRAMRRYEKKLSNMTDQIDIRLEYLDQRSNDAIALAAIAARQNNNPGNMITWLFERSTAVVLLPYRTALAIFTIPFRTASSLLGGSSRSTSEKTYKKGRRSSGSGRYNVERQPARVSRK